MTPDDKRRLAVIRKGCSLYREDECGESSEIGVAMLLLRLLDEAIAERDAAMAALREIADLEGHDPEYTDHDFARDALALANQVLAAHSAATTPTEVQE